MDARWRGASPVPRRKPGVADVEIEGQRVLYDPARRAVTRLDPVASLLWSALDGSGTVADLAIDLASAFEVDEDEALAGVLRLLEQLDDSGFLTL
jgi:hypothetical protein